MTPGTVCSDAPVTVNGTPDWLLRQLGAGFTLLSFGPAKAVDWNGVTAQPLVVGQDLTDAEGLVAARFDGRPGSCYLIRPDQHVAARWRSFDPASVRAAIARACSAKGTY